MELVDLLQEVATDIATAFDWQALSKFKGQAGDGSTTAFDLPTDYDRFPVGGEIRSEVWERGRFSPVTSLDHWQDIKDTLTTGAPGYWILIDRKLNIWPAMSSDEMAKYWYISKNVAVSSTGTEKAAFTADSDTFKLDERLLTLGLVWRWRAQKRMDYAEDLENYNRALAETGGRQKARNILAMGRSKVGTHSGVNLAFPGTIIP